MKYFLLSLSWMIVIWIGSSVPGSSLPGDLNYWSYAAHLAEYGILGYLLARSFTSKSRQTPSVKSIIIVIIIGMLYAGIDEWHQSFVPGRSVNVFDWIFDVLGVIFGIYLSEKKFL